jgi:large subunit ribosomal protein L25
VVLTGEPARNTLVMTENDRLSVLAEALRLPENLEVSIAGLDAGAKVTASDVKLPQGVELAADPDTTLVVITAAPTEEQMAAGGGGEAPEEAPAVEGAEAPAEAATAEA